MKNDAYFEIELIRLIQSANKIMHKVEDESLKKFNLTHFHARYLANLHRFKQMTMGELTKNLGVDKANTTRAVKDLMSRGLIEKVGNGERNFYLQLSELGLTVAQEFKSKLDGYMKASFKDFTLEEKQKLFSLINKLCEGVLNAGNF